MPVIAFFQNIGLPETILIGVLAILIFGRRLPEVAARAAVRVQRMRRSLADLRRETGIDAELRAARRAVEESMPRMADFEERRRPRTGQRPAGLGQPPPTGASEPPAETVARGGRTAGRPEGSGPPAAGEATDAPEHRAASPAGRTAAEDAGREAPPRDADEERGGG